MADRKATAAGDAPSENNQKKKDDHQKEKGHKEENLEPVVEEIVKTPSQIAREEAEYRAHMRRNRFKRRWPEVSKVKISTRPWKPPPPPERLPPVTINRPEFKTKKWVPPYMHRRRRRPKLLRIPAEEVTQPLYEFAKLRRIWHNFRQVEKSKMMLQGSLGCNSKKYSSTACGSQTACIAVVCRVLLEEKTPSQLVKRDVDDVIENGDRYYRQCMLALKCYKGKPQLQLNQLLSSLFYHDNKYTVKMTEVEKGLLAKHPDNIQGEPDLMAIMEKYAGTTYMMILTIGEDKHFLIWGHPPPPEAESNVKTICYIFDPHMLNDLGQPNSVYGAGAFLRYAGVMCFVLDFLANYGDLDAAKKGTPKPTITLTNIEVVQKEPLIREPNYELDLKALKIHCQSEWESLNINALIEKKIKEPPAQLPVPPENPPPPLTQEQIMALRGEDFFLYCPKTDAHIYGRDDLIPLPKSETVLHSLVEIADQNFHSQFQQLDVEKWILHATRHMASHRLEIYAEKSTQSKNNTPTNIVLNLCSNLLNKGHTMYTDNWYTSADLADKLLDSETHLVGTLRKNRKRLPKEVTEMKLKSGEYISRENQRGITVIKWRDKREVLLLSTKRSNILKESTSKRGLVTKKPKIVLSYNQAKSAVDLSDQMSAYSTPLRKTVKWYRKLACIACCVAALAMLRRMRARTWNEDILDETLDLGYNLYRQRGIAVWGKMMSSDPKVFDLCRGIESFFKESDAGVLQIPGEYEVAIWNEGGRYYVYHPWPADRYGYRIGLRDGGKACLLYFSRISRLCEHFLDSVPDMKRRPFSIADVTVQELGEMPEPVNKLKPVAPNRWVVRGRFHEADERFPEEHRGRQATPAAIAAIAMAHIVDPANWTADEVDESLVRGDILYQNTLENLERKGISLDSSKNFEGEDAEEEEVASSEGTLAAADVLDKFRISDYDCIETDVLDSAYCGELNPDYTNGVMSLKQSLRQLFKEHSHAVVTARGASTAVWRHEDHYYMFDPHACDANGFPSDEVRATACLVRVKGGPDALADAVLANLPPGSDDSFNISPVAITATKLNVDIGAPETKLESKAFEWISKGTAAIMMGPRGENTAIGKAAEKAGVPEEDKAGRTIALPAAAAFTAATASVPPPHMHQDHMYNFLDAGAEYYTNHLKKTGRKEVTPGDLTEKFEMGANTFSIELEEPITLPLRLPDEPEGEGGEEEEESETEETGEEEVEEETKEKPLKQIKDALFNMWNDPTKSSHVCLLVGDYHQLGLWLTPGGKVVAFDPAPTMAKGMLTAQRIKKGDELRLQRLKDEMTGEGGEEAEDEELGGGKIHLTGHKHFKMFSGISWSVETQGEEKPEPVPEFVPPESSPALMVFASPGEFIDKLTLQGGLDRKQCLAPYKLYPVKVINELTSVLKEKKFPSSKAGGDEAADEEAAEEDDLIEPLDDTAVGKYFTRLGRAVASLRGRLAQNENYFMDQPNRDNQDSGNAIMGIVVEHIEPYTHWKPALIDAILKYGDRLYTTSLPLAANPPQLRPDEVQQEFHVTNFNVRLEVEGDVVKGDIKASETGGVLSLKKGLERFFESVSTYFISIQTYIISKIFLLII
ncbi:unnamed protein product [Parnassius apollo]|uniref:(apollo) hypothetical protein n=1 Tax=Parnassius apollo TaxID=110799 RepID=A0A8S3WA19_PARAO|nr:unnamed protein product [Parnassius apollo]